MFVVIQRLICATRQYNYKLLNLTTQSNLGFIAPQGRLDAPINVKVSVELRFFGDR